LVSAHEAPLATGVYPQVPPTHASAVHGLPSPHWLALVQAAQPGICTCVQPVVAPQLSVVQAFPSLQSRAAPGRHVPPWQVS
jgi:hypothetical protein